MEGGENWGGGTPLLFPPFFFSPSSFLPPPLKSGARETITQKRKRESEKSFQRWRGVRERRSRKSHKERGESDFFSLSLSLSFRFRGGPFL